MQIESKLPHVGTSIFAVMSAAARQFDAVNLGQGFPNFDPSERLQKLVFEAMRDGTNQYAPMPGHEGLRTRIAEKIASIHGLNFDPASEITVTAGATQAIFTIISAVVRAGDEVVLVEPAYDSYRPSVELAGGIPVVFELSAAEKYAFDWEKFENIVNSKTRLIILNTPSNPSATTMQSVDFQRLTSIVQKTNALILSDEVYEHLVFDGQKHVSIWDFPALRERSFSTHSFGKTYHSTGWKIGYVVASPALTDEFRKVHQFNVFSVNHPAQAGLSEFLKNPSEWLELPDFYQKKRDFFQNLLKNTPFRLLPCAGTYFQNVDFSAISDESDIDFAHRLIREAGVATIPVSAFFSNKKDEKILRMCFAKTEEVLVEAAERLENFVKKRK